MKRLIIDSKKLTPEIISLVKEKYPEGYYEDDIIVFKNHKNETVEAIQVEGPEAIYLIKIGSQLNVELESFDAEIDPEPDAQAEIDLETNQEEEEDVEYDRPEPDEDDDDDDKEEEEEEK